jgi:PAT family beta-lactamase induction signal transducer AmpG
MLKFFKALTSKRMLVMFLMGISSGLQLSLIGGTLQIWMRREEVDLKTIGLFAAVALPFTLKFLWAPLLDRYSLPFLGRRKGWLFLSQVALILCTLALGFTNPKENLHLVALISLMLAFFGATQDILIDALRRETIPDQELGLGSSMYMNGYHIAFRMISGMLAIILADFISWSLVYTVMAGFYLLGILATYLVEEPKAPIVPKTILEAVWLPFKEFFSRPGALVILLFIILYKVGDNMAAQMANPMYVDLQFTNTEIASVTKTFGWISLVLGTFVGAAMMYKLGLKRALIICGLLQAISTYGFSLLAKAGKDLAMLTGVIGFENFTSGMGTAAFAAFMALLTNKRFTVTQYALLTSFMGIPRIILTTPTGYMAQSMGYFGFFTFCTFIALPGLLMITYMYKLQNVDTPPQTEVESASKANRGKV